jgi:hypothetical protein
VIGAKTQRQASVAGNKTNPPLSGRLGRRHQLFVRRLRTINNKEFRRWLADPGYDPVMQAWHRHAANWS